MIFRIPSASPRVNAARVQVAWEGGRVWLMVETGWHGSTFKRVDSRLHYVCELAEYDHEELTELETEIWSELSSRSGMWWDMVKG